MQRVVEIMGNGVRTEILRQLAMRPMTAAELSEVSGLHYSSIHRHLPILEAAGLVSADHPPERRRGAYVRILWSTNPDRVAEIAVEWARYASGQSSD